MPSLRQTFPERTPTFCKFSNLKIPATSIVLISRQTQAAHHSQVTNTVEMAKSKNSSQHNQAKKAHRNGIKKPKTHRYPSLKGTDPKFRRNHRHALHGTMKALKEVKEGKRDAV
ncbi:60S ribosomal protein L29 [Exophiala oligosperma]|uniref:60S ribosomal protein L29 n=1 Tax=Exophiala oligosperma TaxID=215243 RepID=A0A0D2EJX5_9EURO|nr:60S ribosomal protein L29 [Exophiala oligosperma]KIW48209.1 60S ribosomal protein L29 [Exophiala oligosperma]